MKKRIDQLLVIKNFATSRENAKELIMSKSVIVDGKYILKPNSIIDEKANIKILKNNKKYVSRAGLKLEKALKQFDINIKNLICLDIGSSTGGFTECLINKNCKLVYALDVGTNQLNWKLRNNPKVISMEKTNFRYTKKSDFKNKIEFASCDVSFISLEKIIIPLKEILAINGYAIFLIKPQFEAGREEVKKGKINDKKIHIKVINKIIHLCNENGFSTINLTYSPILGNKKKNIEFIILIQRTLQINNKIKEKLISSIVNDAWKMVFNK